MGLLYRLSLENISIYNILYILYTCVYKYMCVYLYTQCGKRLMQHRLIRVSTGFFAAHA